MKKFTKLLALALAAVSAVAMFSGCKKEAQNTRLNDEGKPILEYFLPTDPGAEVTSDSWVIKNWGEKTGTQINVQAVQRDVFAEKIAAVFASGNLPDIINFYQDETTIATYGDQLFVALDEYLEDGTLPNLAKVFEEYPDVKDASVRLDDGKIYGFPAYRAYDHPFAAWQIREDLLNKAGWSAEDIKTIDDLKAALLALKTVNGQPYVTSSRLGWNYFAEFAGYMFGTSHKMLFDNKTSDGTNKWIYGPSGKMFKEMIEFYKWAYENKVIHPSFATMTEQELNAGYKDGKFQLVMEQASMIGTTLGTYSPDYPERKLGVIKSFEINGETPKQAMQPHIHNGYRWPAAVTKTSPNVNAALKAMDWLYSDEAKLIDNRRGEEGVHWVKHEDYATGWVTLNYGSSYWKLKLENGEITEEEYEAVPKITGQGIGSVWVSPYRDLEAQTHKDNENESAFLKRRDDEIQSMIDAGLVVDPDPVVKFTTEEQEEVNDIMAALDTYVSEESLKFIYGKRSMDEWDAFQKQIVELGSKRLEELYNK